MIKISLYDITNMSKLLESGKIAFIEYARRDSIITLKRETDTESFNKTKTNKLVFQQPYQLLVKKSVINE
jgi:hypothetical protein